MIIENVGYNRALVKTTIGLALSTDTKVGDEKDYNKISDIIGDGGTILGDLIVAGTSVKVTAVATNVEKILFRGIRASRTTSAPSASLTTGEMYVDANGDMYMKVSNS